MENKLLSYQNVHVKSLGNSITKYHRALDASDTGTGKTYTTIALCRLLNLRPFIVCPKSVISTWQQVLTYFEYSKNQYDLTTYNQIINHKIIKKKIPVSNNDGEYEWNFSASKYSESDYLFIYDEAHKCKNRNTINAKILIDLCNYETNILLLSATVVDKPLYFIMIGYVLGLYENMEDGLRWMSDICNKKAKHPMLNVHKAIFPEYASRMSINDLQNSENEKQKKEFNYLFKANEVLMDGIKMENYYDIARQYNIMNELMKKKS